MSSTKSTKSTNSKPKMDFAKFINNGNIMTMRNRIPKYKEGVKELSKLGYKLERNCRNCGKESQHINRVLKCGGCKLAVYCSKECQKADWKKHKPFCKSLSNAGLCEDNRVKNELKEFNKRLKALDIHVRISKKNTGNKSVMEELCGLIWCFSDEDIEEDNYHLHTLNEEEFLERVKNIRNFDLEKHRELLKSGANLLVWRYFVAVMKDKN